jgi:hypothetical protein
MYPPLRLYSFSHLHINKSSAFIDNSLGMQPMKYLRIRVAIEWNNNRDDI